MANPLEWALKLVDKASGPAKAASNAVKALATQLKAADSASSKPLKIDISTRIRQEMTKAKSDLKGFGSDVFEQFGGEAALGAAGAAATVAAAIGIGMLAKKGASMAIDAVTFRESTEAAFASILGSQTAAASVFEKADALAGKLGLADEEVVGQLKKLMTSGFGSDTALGIVKTAANLAAVRGEDAAAAFTTLIATTEAKGKFDTRTLNALAKLGVRTEDVYGALANKLGKTTAEVQALAKAGKIDATAGVEAVLSTLDSKFGGAAEKMASSVPRLLFRINDAFGDMFNKVDISPLKTALSGVLSALDGPAGAKMRTGINKMFGGLFDALFGAFDVGRIDSIMGAIGDAFNIIGDIMVAVAPSVKAFIGGLVDGFVEVWPVIKAVGEAIGSVFTSVGGSGVLLDVVKMMGKGFVYVAFAVGAVISVLGIIVGTVLYAGVAIVGVIAAVIGTIGSAIGAVIEFGSSAASWFGTAASAVFGFLGSIWSAVTGVFSAATSIGSNIISGIVSGITSGLSSVVSAITNVAKAAINAAEEALGIASPSKKFEKMGSFTAQGFAGGVANDTSAQDAVDTMIAPPSGLDAQQAGAAAAGAGGGGGKGGGGSQTINITINAEGGDGDSIAAKVREVLEDYGQQFALAAGAR